MDHSPKSIAGEFRVQFIFFLDGESFGDEMRWKDCVSVSVSVHTRVYESEREYL